MKFPMNLNFEIFLSIMVFFAYPPKKYISKLSIRFLFNRDISQFLNDCIYVNVFLLFSELITTVEIDMLPCNRGYLLEQFSILNIAGFLFVRKQVG